MAQLLLMFSVMLSMTFLMGKSPLFLSLIIIVQTITIAIIVNILTLSSWFSFMLLMIYLSGMMIVFIYVSSMASNEFFPLKYSKLMAFVILSIILLTSIFMSNYHPKSDYINILNLDLTQTTIFKTAKMFAKPLFMMTILLIIYLLLAMIMVVKNSSFSSGPMRSAK
uniref:NADH-ubiquinone oxidoreductase chain 6 n=1 Tax=Pseudoniphargus elongatus TaxID=2211489 RepID=A0A345UDN2_9CRUS|nr:NADH dehydrogenase subunit 6 [Pseudoniphargus elongatus]